MGTEVLVLVQNAHGSSSGEYECQRDNPVVKCGFNRNIGHGESFDCSTLETVKYVPRIIYRGPCIAVNDILISRTDGEKLDLLSCQLGFEHSSHCVSHLLTQIAIT